jgi:hypothetical protein
VIAAATAETSNQRRGAVVETAAARWRVLKTKGIPLLILLRFLLPPHLQLQALVRRGSKIAGARRLTTAAVALILVLLTAQP